LGVGDAVNRGDDQNEMGEYLSAINFGTNVLSSDISGELILLLVNWIDFIYFIFVYISW